jgi:hypothetical protein
LWEKSLPVYGHEDEGLDGNKHRKYDVGKISLYVRKNWNTCGKNPYLSTDMRTSV